MTRWYVDTRNALSRCLDKTDTSNIGCKESFPDPGHHITPRLFGARLQLGPNLPFRRRRGTHIHDDVRCLGVLIGNAFRNTSRLRGGWREYIGNLATKPSAFLPTDP